MKKRIQSILICGIAGLIVFVNSSFSLQAQSQTAAKPSFEVISIREAQDCGNVAPGVRAKIPGGTKYGPGGRYATCNLLQYMIMDAYQIHFSSPVTGLPDWSKDVLYNIEAKAEGDPTKEQMRLMVQSLLQDKFKLRMHKESKEGQVYELVVIKSGHKLQQAKDEKGNPLLSLPPPDPNQKMDPGKRLSVSDMKKMMGPGSYSISWRQSGEEFRGRALSMEAFCDSLFGTLRRRVIDKTGLTGLYDIELVYAPPGRQPAPPDPANAAPATEPSAPDIFRAFQEQLGLRLESTKAAMDSFVIDNLEKPPAN